MIARSPDAILLVDGQVALAGRVPASGRTAPSRGDGLRGMPVGPYIRTEVLAADAREDSAGEGAVRPTRRALLVLASGGWGGTEKAFVELANALASSLEVVVAVPEGCPYRDRFSESVAGIRSLRPGSRRNPLVLGHLRRLIREVRPDVVHTHAAKATEMVWWVSRTMPVVQVATKHNTRPRRIFSRVRWVTAVSHQAAATVDHRHGVEVVYNAVPAPGPGDRLPRETFTILAVGRLHRHKGFDLLIREAARLPFGHLLRIAGEGPERARLEKLIRRLGSEGRVELLGHREDVVDLMGDAHVLVVSSRTEGFSLALVEGLLACDLVLSTRVGIAPEILPEELLIDGFEIGEKLCDAHARYDELRALAREARTRAEPWFRMTEIVGRYRTLYEKALAS